MRRSSTTKGVNSKSGSFPAAGLAPNQLNSVGLAVALGRSCHSPSPVRRVQSALEISAPQRKYPTSDFNVNTRGANFPQSLVARLDETTAILVTDDPSHAYLSDKSCHGEQCCGGSAGSELPSKLVGAKLVPEPELHSELRAPTSPWICRFF